MDNDSIVTDELDQDAVADEQLEQQEVVVEDPRAARLTEIAARRSQERQEENGGEPLEEDDQDEQLAGDDEQTVAAPAVQAKESPVFERDGQYFTRLKINGEEVEQPLDKVIAVAQKHEAADVRLNDAAVRQQQLDQREHDLSLREQQQLEQREKQPAPAQLSEEDAAKRKDLITRYNQALYEGEESEAAELMDKMLNMGRLPATPTADPDAIATQAEERAFQRHQTKAAEEKAERRKVDTDRINEQFNKDFSDVVADENLYSMAKQYAADLRKNDPSKPLDEVMTETGKHVREWKLSIQKQATENRRERKRSAARSVTGTNKSASIGKDQPPAPTRSQTIKGMRAGRAGAN